MVGWWICGSSRQALFVQEGCSQGCHGSKNLDVRGVHGEGLSAGIKQVLANSYMASKWEPEMLTANLDWRYSWAVKGAL